MSVTYYGQFSPYIPDSFPMVPAVPSLDELIAGVPPIPEDLEGDALALAQAQRDAAMQTLPTQRDGMLSHYEAQISFFKVSVQWIQNEQGQDLYTLRETLPDTGSFVTLNEDGKIRVVHDDKHKVWPAENGRLYHVDAVLPVSGMTGPGGIEGKLFNPETGEITDPVLPPQPIRRSKVKLFSAMTDDEYNLFQSIESQQPAREQDIFRSATELVSIDPLYPKFEQLMLTAFPNGRGQELLDISVVN